MSGLEGLSRSRRVLLVAAATVVMAILLALLAEGVVRFRAYMKYGFATVKQTYTVDAASGLRIPLAGLRQGGISINSSGFRGPEIVVPKPKDTVRIAFLGASTTYCAEVSSNAKTWPDMVAASLRSAAHGVNVDYVNAAVPGYAVDSMLKSLNVRVRPLDPDIVVIYEATNDLSGATYELARKRGIEAEHEQDRSNWLLEHSLLAYLVDQNLRIIMLQRHAVDSANADSRLVLSESDLANLRSDYRERVIDLIQSAQQSAAVVAIPTFSMRLRRTQSPQGQSEAAITSLYYMPYMTPKGLLDGFEAYNDAIREAAVSTGALLIDDELSIPGDAANFVDSVHFSDAGSEAMARRVTTALLVDGRVRTLLGFNVEAASTDAR